MKLKQLFIQLAILFYKAMVEKLLVRFAYLHMQGVV